MKHGFIRVAAAIPELRVGACSFNVGKITEMIRDAGKAGVEIVVFPELSITAIHAQICSSRTDCSKLHCKGSEISSGCQKASKQS